MYMRQNTLSGYGIYRKEVWGGGYSVKTRQQWDWGFFSHVMTAFSWQTKL